MQKILTIRRIGWGIFGCLLALVSPSGYAIDEIPVLLPDVSPPYRVVFDQILSGISSGSPVPVHVYQLNGTGEMPAALRRDLAKLDGVPVVLICLGRSAVKAALPLLPGVRIVAGAVLDFPVDEIEGVRLAPDPERSFNQLRQISPSVRHVHVVTSADRQADQLARAAAVAAEFGFELSVYPAADLRDAAKAFRELLSRLGSGDALWLSSTGKSYDDTAMLPAILKQAWSRKVVVFSDSLADVRRGVLFALFPDNEGLGRTLAMISAQDEGDRRFLTDTKLALNTRTARHLGLQLPKMVEDQIAIKFPQR